jgi:UDP-2,3-diacylglucosamine hydrolase
MGLLQKEKKIGLIAGMGELPGVVAREARSQGFRIYAIGLRPFADDSLTSLSDEIEWISVGKFGKLLNALKRFGVKEAVMAGKIPKTVVYENKITPDLKAMKLLLSLKDRKDDSILLGISAELEREGITLQEITRFTSRILAPEGVIAGRPTAEEWKDIEFGWIMAKAMGGLDIGQTVIVKGRAVMAVEAIEGTDEAIRRGGRLARRSAVVVKVSKPQQDMRFDVPAIGLQTLEAMTEVRARVLAVEPGKTIMMNKESLISEAKRSGIVIVGYSGTRET